MGTSLAMSTPTSACACGQRVDLLAGVDSGGVRDDPTARGLPHEPGSHLRLTATRVHPAATANDGWLRFESAAWVVPASASPGTDCRRCGTSFGLIMVAVVVIRVGGRGPRSAQRRDPPLEGGQGVLLLPVGGDGPVQPLVAHPLHAQRPTVFARDGLAVGAQLVEVGLDLGVPPLRGTDRWSRPKGALNTASTGGAYLRSSSCSVGLSNASRIRGAHRRSRSRCGHPPSQLAG